MTSCASRCGRRDCMSSTPRPRRRSRSSILNRISNPASPQPRGNTHMYGKRPTITSLHGIVSAAHPLAAQAGAKMLASGGNALDAAAATAEALNVVEPFMSGLAGLGLATCYVAKEQRVRTLDFVPLVPVSLPVERFSKREDLQRGPLSVAAPGNFAGWAELVRAYGKKPLKDALQPAIELARDGFALAEFGVVEINEQLPLLEACRAFYGDWARTYAD